MALTSESKQKVLFFLCHSGKTLDVDSTHYNSVVNSRLNDLNPYTQDLVEQILEELEATRAKLRTSPSKLNVRRIGDIELDTDKSLSLIQGEYKRLQNELSKLLDIPNLCRSSGGIRICGP